MAIVAGVGLINVEAQLCGSDQDITVSFMSVHGGRLNF